MTFLTPVALLGLLLLPGLVALHLRLREARAVDVPSLLLWENIDGEPSRGGRRWTLEHVVLLILQLLAVGALVLSLAQPADVSRASAARVYVIDDGVLMTAADPAPSRLDAAKALITRDIQGAPTGTMLTIVAADARPRVVVSTTDRALALRRLRALQALAATPDWPQALTIAAGLLPSRSARLLIVHAPGETLPPVAAARGVVSADTVGHDANDQAIAALSARCASGATTCSAFASVRNASDRAVQDSVVIDVDGSVLGQRRLDLPARSDTDLSFAVPATHHLVALYLARRDLVAANNAAWAVIPAPRSITVTVVGDDKSTDTVVRALAALPLVHVARRTPRQFMKARGGSVLSDPLVLVGWLPPGQLPAAPSLMLIDPPRFPGARGTRTLGDSTVSGEDAASPLLSGVDLTSLDIPQGAARQLTLPAALEPVVWAADGPLLAAGSLQGRRVAVLTFSPSSSNLSQLDAFPLLMDNMLRWSTSWYPIATAPGDHATLDVPPSTTAIEVARTTARHGEADVTRVTPNGARAVVDVGAPGVYTVTERGAWGARQGEMVVNAGGPAAAGAPIALPAPTAMANIAGNAAPRIVWWPWLGLLAAFVIAAEGVVAFRRAERRGEP